MVREETYEFEEYIENVLKLREIDDIYCQKYQSNRCRDPNCPKIHIKLDKAVVCKHWLRGLCKKGRNCEFLHEYNLKRMPECWFFSKFGVCSNMECIFLHIDPNSVSKECLWYRNGFCRNGPNCRNKHVKKKICLSYWYGFCHKGPTCENGHAKAEAPNIEHQRTVAAKDVIGKRSNLIND